MDVSIYSVPVAERPRRRYSNEYKRQVVEASFQANTSIAAVAQAHQINANLLHTAWLWTYNNERPNMALGGITPRQKLHQHKLNNSTANCY